MSSHTRSAPRPPGAPWWLFSLTLLVFGTCAFAREPLSSGLGELAIFDPGAHERGSPAVEFVEDPQHEGFIIDIPPVVHVHRYYYSGDKEFQGPIIRGGPTMVVANHPKTGLRMYVEVTLPRGAPVISHNKHAITYVYRDRRVSVVFSKLPFAPEKVHVKNHSGRGVGRTAHHVASKVAGDMHAMMEGPPPILQDTAHLVLGIGDFTHQTFGRAGSLAGTAIRMVPGVNNLISRGEQIKVTKREHQIRRAGRIKELQEPQFVPTIR